MNKNGWRIEVLNGWRMVGHDRVYDASGLVSDAESRCAPAILTYLALHHGPHEEESLREQFKPRMTFRTFQTLTSRIRKLLEEPLGVAEGTIFPKHRGKPSPIRLTPGWVTTDVAEAKTAFLHARTLDGEAQEAAWRAILTQFQEMPFQGLEQYEVFDDWFNQALDVYEGTVGQYAEWLHFADRHEELGRLLEQARQFTERYADRQPGKRAIVRDFPRRVLLSLASLNRSDLLGAPYREKVRTTRTGWSEPLAEARRERLKEWRTNQPTPWYPVLQQAVISGPGSAPWGRNEVVGRESALEYARSLLRNTPTRTLIVTGLPGIGRRTFAYRTAMSLDKASNSMVVAVDCAGIGKRESVETFLARHIARNQDAAGNPSAAFSLYRQFQRSRASVRVLILANADAIAKEQRGLLTRFVTQLLRTRPDVYVVVTATLPLDVPGAVFALHGLSTEQSGEYPSDAARLFAQIYRKKSGQDLDTTSDLIEDLCRQVLGAPQAIERMATHLYTGGDPNRVCDDAASWVMSQRGSDAPFSRLLEMIAPAERILLGRLSVFSSPFDDAALRSVFPDVESGEVAALVSTSLLTATPGTDTETIYTLHPLLRAAVWLQFDEQEQARHLDRLLDGMTQMFGVRPAGMEPKVLSRIGLHYNSLCQAIRWGLERDINRARCLLCGIATFWVNQGQSLSEGVRFLQKAASHPDAYPDAWVEMRLCLFTGAGLCKLDRFDEGAQFLDRALNICDTLERPRELFVIVGLLSAACKDGSRGIGAARRYAERAEARFAQIPEGELSGDTLLAHAQFLNNFSNTALSAYTDSAAEASENNKTARIYAERAFDEVARYRRLVPERADSVDVVAHLCLIYQNLGNALLSLGDARGAENCYQEQLRLAKHMGHTSFQACALHNAGLACEKLQKTAEALELLGQARAIRQEIGETLLLHTTLKEIARIGYEQGDASHCVALLREALDLWRVGSPPGNWLASLLLCARLLARSQWFESAVRLWGFTVGMSQKLKRNVAEMEETALELRGLLTEAMSGWEAQYEATVAEARVEDMEWYMNRARLEIVHIRGSAARQE